MTAWVDPLTLYINFHLLVGGLVLVLFLAAAALAVWVAVRIIIWRARVRAGEASARRSRLDEHGRAYPPAAEGICDRCGQPFEQVYYMPSGRRLCPACYRCEVPPDARIDRPRPEDRRP